MRVTHTQQAELAQSGLGTLAAGRKAPTASFAAKLAATSEGTAGANSTAETPKEARKSAPLPKGPKGETTRQVEQHPYLEVMSGPRNGMFINTTNNERRGQAFVLVKRDDHDLHIYGTGKNRRVIISWHKDQPAHADEYRKPAPAPTPTGGATGGTTATP